MTFLEVIGILTVASFLAPITLTLFGIVMLLVLIGPLILIEKWMDRE
jgi:hypothetical protein